MAASIYLSGMKRIAPWLVCSLLFVASCKKSSDDSPTPPPTPPAATDNDPLLPGNPTNAVNNATSSPENYLKDNSFYKISYSKSRGTSNWVAWHLQSEDIGGVPRQDNFRGDALLPGSWYQVQTSDYSSSGFNRGHYCPSGDRTSTISGNSSTFLMTNIMPQAPNLNQGPWEGLEDFVRNSLVGSNKEAFIYMGVTGAGGYEPSGLTTFIASGKITVPAKVWKVALILPKGNGDLARIHSDATVVAVNMPNDNRLYNTTAGGRNDWRNYIVSVNALESDAATAGMSLSFFTAVHDSIKTILKGKIYQ